MPKNGGPLENYSEKYVLTPKDTQINIDVNESNVFAIGLLSGQATTISITGALSKRVYSLTLRIVQGTAVSSPVIFSNNIRWGGY